MASISALLSSGYRQHIFLPLTLGHLSFWSLLLLFGFLLAWHFFIFNWILKFFESRDFFFTTSWSLQRADRSECTRMSNKHHSEQYTEAHISHSSCLTQEDCHEASLGYVEISSQPGLHSKNYLKDKRIDRVRKPYRVSNGKRFNWTVKSGGVGVKLLNLTPGPKQHDITLKMIK